ncbi:MAG: uroporphyrinogen-III C-methyltransferase [Saprospiraceae bacterium]|nr:uroporphyrinogen-III C-methyltransferase [Saprospiraceae bacterium]
MAKLTVVGAGTGDPDLITLKAIKALESADVVLYDTLANEVLLNYAPDTALKIFVGKRRGFKTFEQDDINDLIVTYAESHGHVVRLKGGDPFVFGRGMEEIQFARTKNIDSQYVAGISSAIAVAGSAGIAVTLRGIGRSFWTMTATTETGDLNPDLYLAATSEATIVILMGMGKLPEIVQIFTQNDKAQLPVAVIQNGTLPTAKAVFGTIETIEKVVFRKGVSNPAAIVIGEVVRHRLV